MRREEREEIACAVRVCVCVCVFHVAYCEYLSLGREREKEGGRKGREERKHKGRHCLGDLIL
jgi:hypothetical protein